MTKIAFIHTPANWDELHARIESLTGPGESALATLYAGMAWNMAADDAARDTAGRPPAKLNGHAVVAFAPYRSQRAINDGDFAVWVHLTDNDLTPYCVAHWNQHAGKCWNWGTYCETYNDALRAFIDKAGAGDLSATA